MTHEHAGLSHNDPSGGIGDRKDSFIRLDLFLDDVLLETLSGLLRKEDPFGFLSALGVGQGNPPVLNILRPQTEDLSDAHVASGHEFQDQSVSGVLRPENHLIDNILVESRPLLWLRVSEDLTEDGRVTRIEKVRIEDVLAEVEERRQERVS